MNLLFTGVKKLGGLATSYLIGVAGEVTASAFYEAYQAFKVYSQTKAQGHPGYLEMDQQPPQPEQPQQAQQEGGV